MAKKVEVLLQMKAFPDALLTYSERAISMTGQWKTLKEACEILGVSESTIRRRIKKGEFQSKLGNNKRLIFIQEINQMTGQMTGYAMVQHLQNENERLLQENAELREQLERRDALLEEKDADLRKEREAAEEASHRHDTVVMQMTRLLEYHQQPFWRKLFSRKALPPPTDETIMDMTKGEKKETSAK